MPFVIKLKLLPFPISKKLISEIQFKPCSLKSTAEKLRGTVGVPCPELWLELPFSVLPL